MGVRGMKPELRTVEVGPESVFYSVTDRWGRKAYIVAYDACTGVCFAEPLQYGIFEVVARTMTVSEMFSEEERHNLPAGMCTVFRCGYKEGMPPTSGLTLLRAVSSLVNRLFEQVATIFRCAYSILRRSRRYSKRRALQ
jgi:hypothetical protein